MKRTVTAVVAGLALTGVVGAGVAVASTNDGPPGRLADVLTGLVDKGTITQSQADAVSGAITEDREQFRAEREERRTEHRAEIDAVLTKVLGLTSAEVRAKLADGQSLRDIVGDKDEALVDALLANLEEHLAEAVSDGRMTQDMADEFLARATEQSQAWLDGTTEFLGRGFGLGMRGDGMRGDGMRGGPGHGPGGHRGQGGMGPGGMFGQPDDTSDSSASA